MACGAPWARMLCSEALVCHTVSGVNCCKKLCMSYDGCAGSLGGPTRLDGP